LAGVFFVPISAGCAGVPIIVHPIIAHIPKNSKIVTFCDRVRKDASARVSFVRVVRTVVAIDRAVNVVHGDYLLDFVNSL
jgi:hypothetical protein